MNYAKLLQKGFHYGLSCYQKSSQVTDSSAKLLFFLQSQMWLPNFLQISKVTTLILWYCMSRAKHTGFSKAWFCAIFSFHKARPQKSRQAISCYFVFSHLWSYLHSILIMLFSNGSSYSKYLFFRSQDFLSPQSSAFHCPDQPIRETAFMLLRQNSVFL